MGKAYADKGRALESIQESNMIGDIAHWRTQDLKKGGGVVVEGDHQKWEGAGGGCAPSRAKRGSF